MISLYSVELLVWVRRSQVLQSEEKSKKGSVYICVYINALRG